MRRNFAAQLEEHGLVDPGFSDEDFREALSFTSQHVGKAVRVLLDRVRNEPDDTRLLRLVRAARFPSEVAMARPGPLRAAR